MLKRTSAILGSEQAICPNCLPFQLYLTPMLLLLFSSECHYIFMLCFLERYFSLADQFYTRVFFKNSRSFFNIYILLFKYFTSKYDVCLIIFLLSQTTSVLTGSVGNDVTVWQQQQQEISKGPTGIMEGRGTEYLHQGKEKVFGKKRLKIIEAEG